MTSPKSNFNNTYNSNTSTNNNNNNIKSGLNYLKSSTLTSNINVNNNSNNNNNNHHSSFNTKDRKDNFTSNLNSSIQTLGKSGSSYYNKLKSSTNVNNNINGNSNDNVKGNNSIYGNNDQSIMRQTFNYPNENYISKQINQNKYEKCKLHDREYEALCMTCRQ
jgi:hypothetical protein